MFERLLQNPPRDLALDALREAAEDAARAPSYAQLPGGSRVVDVNATYRCLAAALERELADADPTAAAVGAAFFAARLAACALAPERTERLAVLFQETALACSGLAAEPRERLLRDLGKLFVEAADED